MGKKKEKEPDHNNINVIEIPTLQEYQERIIKRLLKDISDAGLGNNYTIRSNTIRDYHTFVSAIQIDMLTEKQRGISIPAGRGTSGLIQPVM